MLAGIDMHGTEIEIKLRIEDPARLIAAVEKAGARLVRAREFEDNRLYDFPGQDLMRRDAMLRVRSLAGGALLTYKDSPRVEEGAKVRHEIEVRFDADGPLVAILERIGMVPQFRYQKFRTTWARGDLEITLDETPIGIFAELEGPKPAIDAMAAELGYGPSDYIAGSYRELYFQSLPSGDRGEAGMVFPP
jgi:adenylate cyclase class 2